MSRGLIIHDVRKVELEETVRPWYGKPIRRKVLRKDPITGALDALITYPPALNAPAHRHNCSHTMFILDGKMLINGKAYGAGTYAYFPANETMTHTTPPDSQCTFLLMFERSTEFIVEGGPTYKMT
jgi:quercetin dioxygenase-like cupin family protein